LNGGRGLFDRSIVSGNSGSSHDGGIDVWAARLSLTNVVIADNYAVLGNGVCLCGSPLDALHATVARNSGGQGFDFTPNGADAHFACALSVPD